MLKKELGVIKEESMSIEDKMRKEFGEKTEKDIDQRLGKVRDEFYFKGRKEATDEMALENKKLREIIESLR